MSQIKTLNGVQYTLPQYNDTGWGANTGNVLTQYMAAIADVTLQLTGGAFTLTADVNFGASFGVVSTYFKSRTANIATAGQVRLASADVISFRNNANGANIDLSKDTSDNLKWNATKILLSGAVVNADINAAAAIAYSKLNLALSIVNADISASAAIAYSKLTLTASVVNADIAAAAAIAHTKMAALTASKAPVLDASGFIVASSVTATELGYLSGVTSAIQTQFAATVSNPLTANLVGGAHKITLQPGTNLASLDGTGTIFQIGANYDLGSIADATRSACNINFNTPAAASSITINTASLVNTGSAVVATFASAGCSFTGTNTNDSAAAGIIGEYIESLNGANFNFAAASTYDDGVSISLTAGDWDVSACGSCEANGGTWSSVEFGISSTSGNSGTGLQGGKNDVSSSWANTSTVLVSWSFGIPTFRVSLSATTTYYLKRRCVYTAGTPRCIGIRISARRVR